MELLELLKRAHRQVTTGLDQLANSVDGQPAFENLQAVIREQLRVERDYIFAEVSDGSRATTNTLKALEAQQSTILEKLDLSEVTPESLMNLKQLILKYFAAVQDRLLPLVRQLLSTSEREELAQVVADALEECVFVAGMVAAV